MRTFVNLSETEASAVRDNRLTTLVRPLRIEFAGAVAVGQNPKIISFYDKEHNWIGNSKKRFPVGSEIWGRETYRPACYPPNTWEYKVDCPPEYTGWWSPVTMPTDAIRHKWVVKTNRVCLVNDLTVKEVMWAWWSFRHAEQDRQFTRRYPKLSFDKAWVEVVGI